MVRRCLRIELPGWYGLGSALEAHAAAHGEAGIATLGRLYGRWPFLASLIDNAELEKRRAALAPLVTPDWAKRGYAHLFNETILQADEGCDFDFMRSEGKG